ncbi:hypothetical protein [Hymenobacter sp. CRA2]|uniref:hypothetical protein n=1 Tax=Hymenobacter sp. CRA2 TaxID=1955620 RepID=UPI00098FD8B8|nr:hypothetical protein [Hymenobacter sp. CRA2]OON71021.1 hypothetical protein B0919_03220 [Hymenobacter sp. CRA2]
MSVFQSAIRLPYLPLLAALLVACGEQRRPAEKPAAAPAVDSTARAPAPAPPDTVDASQTSFSFGGGRDTSFTLNGQRYRLLLRAETDSAKPLTAVSEGIVGEAFAADTATFAQTQLVRGYEGAQLITLLDPAGRQVFRRRLPKSAFFAVAGRDVVTVSEPQRPRFIGAHGPSQTLAFTIDIGVPGSDVSEQCVLLLGFDGNVKRLAISYASSFGAADCSPRLLPDGTVLTCQELIWPGGMSHLVKRESELIAAFMLSDTTLCTVYRYGAYKAVETSTGSPTEYEPLDDLASAGFAETQWVEKKSMRNSPNAFVINTRGQVRRAFRYEGYQGAIAHAVPRRYVWQTHSYYLLDEERGLYVLDKHNPTQGGEIRFKQMQRFRKPQRPQEVRFVIGTETRTFAFYVDPAKPTQLRYERIERRD